MSLNPEQEKQSLKESFRNTENLNETLQCLEYILKNHTPFALYIATADHSNCMWIFNPQVIYDMLGGEDQYNKIFDSLYQTEEERQTGIVFFVFKKVGPLYSVKIDVELIDEIINELYDEL